MNLKSTPIMVALLFSFSINSINFSMAEKIADTETTVIDSAEVSTAQGTIENPDVITINDPVATYNGIPISKEEFLDYMEGQTGIRSDEFRGADSLEVAIKVFLLQSYKQREADKLGLNKIPENILETDFIKKSMLAGYASSHNLISEEQIQLQQEKIKDAPLNVLEIFAKVNFPSINFDEIKGNSKLQKVIQDSYKKQQVVAPLALEDKADEDRQFRIMLNSYLIKFWDRKYDEYFIEQLTQPSEKELEHLFSKWISSQDFNHYKFSHIYIDNENEAKSILDQIQKDEILFIDAVQKYSLDSNSKKHDGKVQRGGAVQFVDPETPLAQALRNMKPGELKDRVVPAIEEGYFHIIYLDDVQIGMPPENMKNDFQFKRRLWEENKLKENDSRLDSEFTVNLNLNI